MSQRKKKQPNENDTSIVFTLCRQTKKKTLPSIAHIAEDHPFFVVWVIALRASLAIHALPTVRFNLFYHRQDETDARWVTLKKDVPVERAEIVFCFVGI